MNSKHFHEIKVQPRWPYLSVLISERALAQLKHAQSEIRKDLDGINLILTRGYESYFTTKLRRIPRKLGSIIFAIIYPSRKSECIEIFSPNGHDESGDHIDVSVELDGCKLKFLPWGVFTSAEKLNEIHKQNSKLLTVVWTALQNSGFKIHPNRTESLQIHCDLQ